MFDPETVGHALALIRLASDPQACQARLDQLMAAAVKANETRVAAERAVTAMNNREAEVTAALDEREAAIAALEARWQARVADLDDRPRQLRVLYSEIERMDETLRRRVMAHNHLRPFFDERMQSLPSWDELEAELAARRDDPIDDPNSEAMNLEPAPGAPAVTVRRPHRAATAAERRM
jgi:predicted nuclease with TOPRIM domain